MVHACHSSIRIEFYLNTAFYCAVTSMSKSVIILICAVLCALSTGAAQVDSFFYVTGGRGMVPCKDGSFIGGSVSCRGPELNSVSDWCHRPVLTRSWDGGKSWTPEDVDAPDYSPSGIVRLRNGDLEWDEKIGPVVS